MPHLIAIPAHNVAATIGDVLRDLTDQRDHVLVVDDGSADGTGDLVRSLGFRTVRHRRTRGVGRALKTAIDYASGAGYDVVVALDADGQHPPRLVKTFLAELDGHSFVLGKRFG